ncbi:MAG: hypothetical protein V3R45_04395 [Candidatus Aminicenantaceae bacterium]
MKKITLLFTLTVFVLAAATGLMFGQSVDLSGTWVGETEIPDAIEPDVMTLVIAKEDGEYSAKLSDSMGMLDNTECEDIEFIEGKLTFNMEAHTGEEFLTVFITVKVEGDTMTGFWETEDGQTGSIELTKK